MTRMSDLPHDLVAEILSRVPLTSLRAVRSTCKTWKALSRTQIFGKTRKQYLGFMVVNFRLCSMKFDLQGLHNDGDFVDPSIKPVSMLNYVDIYKVFHCDGLLLCLIKDTKWRVVWNPYLDETRWIRPINDYHRFHRSDMYAFGYSNNDTKNRNHKILRFLNPLEYSDLPLFFEIYDFNSDSWRILDVNPDCDNVRSVSLKGNTYFIALDKKKEAPTSYFKAFLLCFDFTVERFGPRLPLPFHSYMWDSEEVNLSCVRDEQLAVLYQRDDEKMEIWITTSIEPNAVSWSYFLRVELTTLPCSFFPGSFFIDEEKKVAVVFDFRGVEWTDTYYYQTAYIIGEAGCLKSVKFGEAPELWTSKNIPKHFSPLLFSSYVPSLVQLQINQRGKRKERDYY